MEKQTECASPTTDTSLSISRRRRQFTTPRESLKVFSECAMKSAAGGAWKKSEMRADFLVIAYRWSDAGKTSTTNSVTIVEMIQATAAYLSDTPIDHLIVQTHTISLTERPDHGFIRKRSSSG
jgi:hypothetical protein